MQTARRLVHMTQVKNMLSATLFCDTCGIANRAQAIFCIACGRRLHAPQAGSVSRVSNSLTGLLLQHHTLKQRYRIISQVGKGGFGAVYKAADTQFGNRLVAIKEMSQSGLGTQELLDATEAFKREALLLASLTHPNLPRIYEQFTDAGRWYLVMDFIEGQTLEERLSQANGGCLPIEQVLEIGIQLCTVLDYLHTRQPAIIFRDLKPGNVMLTSNEHVYLIDFGIARHFKPGQAKDTVAFGSPGYAAPEQYGRVQTTPRSDIYCLGSTLHQMLTGDDPSHTPFHFAPLQLNDQWAQSIEPLLMQMVEMDASKRPDSMAVVKQELQRIAANRVALSGVGSLSGSVLVPLAGTLSGGQVTGQTNPPQVTSAAAVPAVLSQSLGTTYWVCCGHSTRVTSVAWSPDSTRIASASFDKTVQIWDSSTGKTVLTYRGHAYDVWKVQWSPAGKYLASASGDPGTPSTGGDIQVWDINGKRIVTYTGHTDSGHSVEVTDIAWSPDGTNIVSAGRDGTIQVWNATTGNNILTYAGSEPVGWSPDDKRIVSGAVFLDHTVQVRDATTGYNTYIYHGYSAQINVLAWSPDSTRIALAGLDGIVQVWQAK